MLNCNTLNAQSTPGEALYAVREDAINLARSSTDTATAAALTTLYEQLGPVVAAILAGKHGRVKASRPAGAPRQGRPAVLYRVDDEASGVEYVKSLADLAVRMGLTNANSMGASLSKSGGTYATTYTDGNGTWRLEARRATPAEEASAPTIAPAPAPATPTGAGRKRLS